VKFAPSVRRTIIIRVRTVVRAKRFIIKWENCTLTYKGKQLEGMHKNPEAFLYYYLKLFTLGQMGWTCGDTPAFGLRYVHPTFCSVSVNNYVYLILFTER
jgi:hypothetical protein